MTIQQVFGRDEELSLLLDNFLSSLPKVGASHGASEDRKTSGETPHSNGEKERKEVEATSIVPGVIRHTSQPDISLAYYYSYK